MGQHHQEKGGDKSEAAGVCDGSHCGASSYVRTLRLMAKNFWVKSKLGCTGLPVAFPQHPSAGHLLFMLVRELLCRMCG